MYKKPANSQFVHIIVMVGYETVFQKRCLDISEANALLKEKKEEYAEGIKAGTHAVFTDKF